MGLDCKLVFIIEDEEEKIKNAELFSDGLSFEDFFTFKNFMVKRTEYCYAGEWSGVLDMKTGILKTHLKLLHDNIG